MYKISIDGFVFNSKVLAYELDWRDRNAAQITRRKFLGRFKIKNILFENQFGFFSFRNVFRVRWVCHVLVSRLAQWLACWAHNPKVPGSKPGSATLIFGQFEFF